jgi:hypothetical protein
MQDTPSPTSGDVASERCCCYGNRPVNTPSPSPRSDVTVDTVVTTQL